MGLRLSHRGERGVGPELWELSQQGAGGARTNRREPHVAAGAKLADWRTCSRRSAVAKGRAMSESFGAMIGFGR